MMASLKIGVTGHIDITGRSRALVAAEIARELGKVEGELTGLTSLAPGADQVFAWAVKARGGSLTFVRPADDIETTIPIENIREFQALVALADETVAMPFVESSEDAYFAAGSYIADESDVLLAVWDGRPSGGLGGTGDIVLRRRARGGRLTVVWPEGAERSEG